MPEATVTDPEGEAMFEFAHVQHGLLSSGTVTSLGTIEQTSDTAYKIDGCWVPFRDLHGPYGFVAPLVTFG